MTAHVFAKRSTTPFEAVMASPTLIVVTPNVQGLRNIRQAFVVNLASVRRSMIRFVAWMVLLIPMLVTLHVQV